MDFVPAAGSQWINKFSPYVSPKSIKTVRFGRRPRGFNFGPPFRSWCSKSKHNTKTRFFFAKDALWLVIRLNVEFVVGEVFSTEGGRFFFRHTNRLAVVILLDRAREETSRRALFPLLSLHSFLPYSSSSAEFSSAQIANFPAIQNEKKTQPVTRKFGATKAN